MVADRDRIPVAPWNRKFILQTARIYSRAADKSTLLAVYSRDLLQVLSVCSINWFIMEKPIDKCCS